MMDKTSWAYSTTAIFMPRYTEDLFVPGMLGTAAAVAATTQEQICMCLS